MSSLAQRGAPSRLRNWSGKLGSHITQLRGTLSPNADNVSNVTTTLRGLFQRQGSGSNGNLPTFTTLPPSARCATSLIFILLKRALHDLHANHPLEGRHFHPTVSAQHGRLH